MDVRRGIRYKFTCLMLGMVLTAVALAAAVSVYTLLSVERAMEESSRELGESAALDAEKALEETAVENLRTVSLERASYIEEKFAETERYVRGIATQAEDIYEHPERYPERLTPLPAAGSQKLAAQLLWSERLADRNEESRIPPYTEEVLKLGNLQDMLVQYNACNDMVSSAYIASESGWMLQADYIAYSKYTKDPETPDFYEAKERQWYKRAAYAERGKAVYSDVISDIHQGGDCIVCAQAVYREGEVVAVAGVGSYLDTVREVVLRTTVGETGYAFLADRNGKVVISPKTEGETAASDFDLRQSENSKLAQLAAGMTAGESGTERLMLDGREVYLAYAPLKNMGWSFAAVMDVEEAVAPAVDIEERILKNTALVSDAQKQTARKTFFFFALLAAAAAAVTLTVSTAFAGKITEPVRRLAKEAAKIDGEHFGHRVCIKTGDEIEMLGNAFNRMTGQLEIYIGKLAKATAERERIRTEIQVASKLQADMLPAAEGAFADRKEFCLHASMTPAKGVGGDFYDFFLIDEDHLALVMADVSGKGVPAALFMVVASTLIRSRISACRGEEKDGDLAKAVREINESLCANNKNDMFVTAWVGILTLSTGRLRFVNAGHCPPVVIKGSGAAAYERRTGGFVLAGMEGSGYREACLYLERDDMLLLYTDGVTEACDREKKFYGETKLFQTAGRARGKAPKEFLQVIRKDIRDFQGEEEQFDDITMLALQYRGDSLVKKTGKPEIENIRVFADFMAGTLEQYGISKKTAVKLELAFDELFSNICYYSGAKEVTAGVGVRRQGREDREVLLCLEDDGIPYNLLERPDPDVTLPAKLRKVGGLGIYLVKKLSDRMEYRYSGGKNRILLVKRDRQGSPAERK